MTDYISLVINKMTILFKFWKREQHRPVPLQQLINTLLAPEKRLKSPSSIYKRIKTILGRYPALNINEKAISSLTQQPIAPLTAAISSGYLDEPTKLSIIELLLNARATPIWQTTTEISTGLSDYELAIDQKLYSVARRLVSFSAHHHHPDNTLNSMFDILYRASLKTNLPMQHQSTVLESLDSASSLGSSLDNHSGSSELSDNNTDTNLDDPAWWNTCMDDLGWLLSQCSKAQLEVAKPEGNTSLIHSALAAFAQLVDQQAKLKHMIHLKLSLMNAIVNNQASKRLHKESELHQQRAAALSMLMTRLWAVLHMSLEAGAPAIHWQTTRFPDTTIKSTAVCNHDLIWQGIKTFATAWPEGQWSRHRHGLYHPRFKAAVQELVKIGHCRGFMVDTGECYRLDGHVLERIIGFMGRDDAQTDWIPKVIV